jgi:hypothetical protein
MTARTVPVDLTALLSPYDKSPPQTLIRRDELIRFYLYIYVN